MAGPGVLLLMAQIDDAPGELLGRVVSQLGDMGAKNVQLLSSLGKKGRPGYVLLVDIEAGAEAEVAMLLALELGIWGYRVLESRHEHFDIRRYRTELALRRNGVERRFPLRIKRVLSGGTFIRAKAEHDDLTAICAAMEGERPLALAVLKAAIETAVGASEPASLVTVDLDAPTG